VQLVELLVPQLVDAVYVQETPFLRPQAYEIFLLFVNIVRGWAERQHNIANDAMPS